MDHDLKTSFWWPGMKRDITEYVARCLTCQKVKYEHQKPSGLLQPLEIPEWKWDSIAMDFVVRLPRTQEGFDAIWLRRYLSDPSYVLQPEEMDLEKNLTYLVQPFQILERSVKRVHSKEIPLVKVLWNNKSAYEATWEREDDIRNRDPELFN
ncbi:uncharacterized protein LOC133304514 [Gastrolobium bilobum]|uniref:uncharacterized protein LOC133304514 n=1 Tax=Gastrolobium bilobum TaxID=150636 RepID=UPI002AAF2CD1|nr:uncharacterized protein LOC133304514 [Gastrolobium bilobum]